MSNLSNERSKTLIRELYQLSEAGAFDHISEETADAFCDQMKTFMDPVLTFQEAADASRKSLGALYSKVYRSGIEVYERMKGLRWRDVKRIRDKKV